MSTIEALPFPPQNHEASYPGLSFITVLDPGESKLPSQRKAVRSHAASYQSSKSWSGCKSSSQRKQPRKRNRKALWRGEAIIFDIGLPSQPKHDDRTLFFLPELR